MALLIRSVLRNGLVIHKRQIHYSAVTRFINWNDMSIAPSPNSKIPNELVRLEPTEVASGIFRQDILTRIGQDLDPFSITAWRHGAGTKEEPNLIPSAYDCRIVGCICEDDSDTIVWMWLHKGESKRCICGFYFKLYYEPMVLDTSPMI